jgi:hypothetical protein
MEGLHSIYMSNATCDAWQEQCHGAAGHDTHADEDEDMTSVDGDGEDMTGEDHDGEPRQQDGGDNMMGMGPIDEPGVHELRQQLEGFEELFVDELEQNVGGSGDDGAAGGGGNDTPTNGGDDLSWDDLVGLYNDIDYLLQHPDEGDEFDGDEEARRRALAQPIYNGARMTVKQYCYALLREKRVGRIRDGAFNRHLDLLHSCILPPGNIVPKSYYRMKSLLGVATAEKYEWHICSNNCCAFPPIPRKEWAKHVDEVGDAQCTVMTLLTPTTY